MMSRIQVLPEELCNKIAAGEVVERPSSVVKELIENAIDAGAVDILVELEAGGRKLIRVADNGSGMDRQDAFLSLERHATSKISSDEDLFALHTLGFRGEALASIASVARFRLRTSANDDGLGYEIYAEGGNIRKTSEVGLPRGTSVEVRNLFFNLPARRKFLRKEQTELSHAADVVTKQALAHPEISFRLQHNGRKMLDLRRENGLPERVAALLGRSLLRDMLPVDFESGDLRLHGLLSQPALNRSAGTHIYTFVNGRYIRDRVVQHAVIDSYRQLLMRGRYPVVVLFLELDPAQVDINVHPTKHEVRFREQGLVHDFIVAGIREVLRPSQWLNVSPEKQVFSTEQASSLPPEPSADKQETVQDIVTDYRLQHTPASNASAGNGQPDLSRAEVTQPPEGGQLPLTLGLEDSNGFFSGLQLLGQYHQSYLLCQDGDDLLLIDQHAAHERIGFEKLKNSYLDGRVERQQLLFPEMLELDFRSADALIEHSEELDLLGFELEPFGGKSFALKAVPPLLKNGQVGQLVVDVAMELDRIGKSGQLMERIDEILILMACHGVLRANQALTRQESLALLHELDQVDFKAHCPHGRPVMQRLTLTEVEKLFRRQ
ncbi:MAG TPA: DNA mismatch repair endonuclease MutL [Geopsychrobacteraceae bacterium]|nr:DNA mismatch repair endonuclease MutL [Geopsychrobacteraceae bacterium]